MDSPLFSSGKIDVNGIRIYYELHGEGMPLVFIAGFGCDHTFWASITSELAKQYRVLLVDNRGIGQSDAPDIPYTIDLMADDVMFILNALNIKNPIIIGQSMGSAIAQNIGRRFQNEIIKLVLINTFAKVFKAPQIAFELIGQLHRMNIPLKYRVQAIVPWIYSNEFLSQPHQLDHLIVLAEKNPYPQTLVSYERQLESLQIFNSSAWLHEINLPTLIIAAEDDIVAPPVGAKQVANAIGPKAKMQIFPGGHATPIEQPQKTIQAIKSFIKEG